MFLYGKAIQAVECRERRPAASRSQYRRAVVGRLPKHGMREVVRIHDKSASWPDCVKPPDGVSIAFRKPQREALM